jgi:hypothetical protein
MNFNGNLRFLCVFFKVKFGVELFFRSSFRKRKFMGKRQSEILYLNKMFLIQNVTPQNKASVMINRVVNWVYLFR